MRFTFRPRAHLLEGFQGACREPDSSQVESPCGRESSIFPWHGFRGTPQVSRGKCVSVPTQIMGKPTYDLEAAGAVGAFEPARGHFADAPAKPMTLYQELNAVTEAAVGLDRDPVDRATREQAKTVAGIARRQACNVVKREIRAAYQKILQPRTADHCAPGHETARAYNVASSGSFGDH